MNVLCFVWFYDLCLEIWYDLGIGLSYCCNNIYDYIYKIWGNKRCFDNLVGSFILVFFFCYVIVDFLYCLDL